MVKRRSRKKASPRKMCFPTTRRDFVGHQTSRAIKLCREWLGHWDHDQYVPSIRIACGGPTQEQTAQVLLVAVVRRLNGRMPKVAAAFIAHVDGLVKDIRNQGFGLGDGVLWGVINFSYWLLREGPAEAMSLYPAISWQKISQRWPQEPFRGEEGAKL